MNTKSKAELYYELSIFMRFRGGTQENILPAIILSPHVVVVLCLIGIPISLEVLVCSINKRPILLWGKLW